MPLDRGRVFFSPFYEFFIFSLYNQEKSKHFRWTDQWVVGGWMGKHLESAEFFSSLSLHAKASLSYVCVYLFITNYLQQSPLCWTHGIHCHILVPNITDAQ